MNAVARGYQILQFTSQNSNKTAMHDAVAIEVSPYTDPIFETAEASMIYSHSKNALNIASFIIKN